MIDPANDPLDTSLRQTRGAFVSTSVLLFLYALVTAGSPYLIMQFFNHVIDGAPAMIPVVLLQAAERAGLDAFQAEAAFYAGALLGLGAIGAWLSRLEETAPLNCALGAISRWRRTLLRQLLHGRLSYFETHSANELAARVSDDGLIVENLLISTLKALAKSLPLLVLMIIGLALHSATLAIAFVLTVVPFYLVAASYVRADWVRSKRSDLENTHFRQEIQHSLLMVASLKSLSVEDEALDQLALRSERSIDQALLSRRARGSLTATVTGAKQLLRTALVVFAAWLVVTRQFSVGPFILFAIYTELMPAAVIELARCVALARTAAPALERLRGLAASLENGEETEGSRKTSSLPFPDAGVLSFDNVALKTGAAKFSAEFEPGELIGVVGMSGRSSFGRLLNRLTDPAEGQIQIGRTQLKSFSLDLLRRTVTLVDRHPYFMTASVRENLALAIERDTDLDVRKVNEALSAAGVDFVGDLPNKLETVIGDTAYRLTESQTLRLAVARALLRVDSRIFFFDEVTAGLEASEARLIFEAVQTLTDNGAIVFWVTRRADEANECDRILFLEPSAKDDLASHLHVAVETHEKLIASSVTYRQVLGVREPRRSPGRNQGDLNTAKTRVQGRPPETTV